MRCPRSKKQLCPLTNVIFQRTCCKAYIFQKCLSTEDVFIGFLLICRTLHVTYAMSRQMRVDPAHLNTNFSQNVSVIMTSMHSASTGRVSRATFIVVGVSVSLKQFTSFCRPHHRLQFTVTSKSPIYIFKCRIENMVATKSQAKSVRNINCLTTLSE